MQQSEKTNETKKVTPEPAECSFRETCKPHPLTRKAVYVHAFSLDSVLGCNPRETIAALHTGHSLVNGQFSACSSHRLSEEVAELLDEARKNKRLAEYENTQALQAMLECLLPLVHTAFDAGIKPEDLGLVLGTTTAGLNETISDIAACRSDSKALLPMALGRATGTAASVLGIQGPAYVVSTACTAGAKAIAEAARLLRSERAEAVIAGGLDVLNPLTDAGFTALGASTPKGSLPFAADREGLALGPGGGFLLLTTEPVLVVKGVPQRAFAKLAGWGETSDAHHISAPDPTGVGARLAMEEALRRAKRNAKDVDLLLLHGTGTKQNDAMEAKAVHAVFGERVPAASLKRAVGHQLAGAGAFASAVAVALLNDAGSVDAEVPLPLNSPAELELDPSLESIDLINQPRCARLSTILVNAFAFGGSNVSLLFEACSSAQLEDKERA